MQKDKFEHLRLVSNNASPAEIRRTAPTQLPLPYVDADLLLLFNVLNFHPQLFRSLLRKYLPTLVVDIRVAPRLDILASTRAHAHKLFESRGIHYVDLFAMLSVSAYSSVKANPICWRETTQKLIREQPNGPYFMLFDNQPLLDASAVVLRETITAKSKRNVNLVAEISQHISA